MDEIGRGTSTYDGLSLAWACARELMRGLGSFTLFATHYFELTSLADELAGCANVHLDAIEHGEELVFLHAVREGPANRSFGLQVARLAGCRQTCSPRRAATSPDSNAAIMQPRPRMASSGCRSTSCPTRRRPRSSPNFARLDPDALSPRDAQAALYRLRELLGSR